MDQNVTVDGELTDESDDEDGVPPVGDAIAIGATVDVHGVTWRRVDEVSTNCRKQQEFDLQVRHRTINDDTTELELLWLCMPVSRQDLLQVVRDRAAEAHDKYKEWNAGHVDGVMKCLLGGAQFKEGTDLWATEARGLIPPPDFGRIISKDRFDRVLRYWARGAVGVEAELTEQPWGEVMWFIDGFNETRNREFRAGSRLTPDESMIGWQGQSGAGGIPHLSFVKRKPKPLGAEFKTVCDGSTGMLLHLEIQEGKVRMQRKKFVNSFPATTACTLRMMSNMEVGELELADNAKLRRAVTADSWFASRATAIAMQEKLGLDITGPVKTATKGFPIEAMRWTLKDMSRGQHCVFKEEGRDLWAVGWSDVHFKCYVTTHGITTPGEEANKKRQRADGRNYHIKVARPAVVADYQKEMGWVDRHNRFRQGMLKFDEVWKTKRWQTRVQLDIIGMAIVDAFLLARKFIPRWGNQPDTESVFF